MVDMRRERAHIQRNYKFMQSTVGEAVMWHEFDAANTIYHPVYNEGNRHYKPGIMVPCLWVIHTDDSKTYEDIGRRSTPTLRLAVPIDTLRKVGLSAPLDADRHLNDLVVYRNTFFGVGDYEPQGRIAGQNMVVGVNAAKIEVDESMIFDVLPELGDPNETKRPRGRMNDTYELQVFPNHEHPANQT